MHVYAGQKPLDISPAFGVRHPDRAVIAVEGIKATFAPYFLVVSGKRRARSSAGVEETRKEDDDEAFADTSGSARYGWGEKGGGAQVVYGGEEEGVRRSSIGEGHVGILSCQSEGRGWGSVVGHFELCYVTLDRGICVIGVTRFVTWSHKPIAPRGAAQGR